MMDRRGDEDDKGRERSKDAMYFSGFQTEGMR